MIAFCHVGVYAESMRVQRGTRVLCWNMTRIVIYFTEKFVLRIVDNLFYASNVCRAETASNSSFEETRNAFPVWCRDVTASSTGWHLLLVIHHGHHYDRQAAAISSWGGQDERSGTERSLSLHLESGIVFLQSWRSCDRLLHSRDIWKLSFIFFRLWSVPS